MTRYDPNSTPTSESALAAAIAAFIAAPEDSQGGDNFLEPALALFAYQYANNPPFRTLCDSLGANPDTVNDLEAIPAVPAAAYKRFMLSCAPPERIVSTFFSSGTTAAERSVHAMTRPALELYELSLLKGYRRYFPDDLEIWALMEPASTARNSSLSHMLQTLGATRYFWNDRAALEQALSDRSKPVALFGTAFAYVDLFDGSQGSWRLPEGSCVIETGGFKGRTREVPRPELYALFNERLGVPDDRCHAEYGMSEMSSQFYSTGAQGLFSGPPWVKTRCIDPVTGTDSGKAGLLCHYDLANLNSVMVLQTEDLGVPSSGSFALLGRAFGAELRGCSLTVEELWKLTR